MKIRNTTTVGSLLLIGAGAISACVSEDDAAEIEFAESPSVVYDTDGDSEPVSDYEVDAEAEALVGEDPTAPVGCKWRKNYGTGTSVRVDCPAWHFVVSGGCFQQPWSDVDNLMTRNGPFEGNNVTNYPESGERWNAVDGTNGWACGREQSESARLYATALCCYGYGNL